MVGYRSLVVKGNALRDCEIQEFGSLVVRFET